MSRVIDTAPVAPPRKSLHSSKENTPRKKKNEVREFTIENFVNQSLANEDCESDEDDDSSSDPVQSKLSFNSLPDLVPLNDSHQARQAANKAQKADFISPKIKSLLDTLAKPKEKSLAEFYHDTLKISPLKSRKGSPLHIHVGSRIPHDIPMMSGEPRQLTPTSLIESIVSGGGKVTSWRSSGKIRSWHRSKLLSRIKAVARQIQENLQLKPGDVVGLAYDDSDIDHVTTLLGCLMAGVDAFIIPEPENSPIGVKFQLKTMGVNYIFTSSSIYRASQKKEEKERFLTWYGIKIITASKSSPSQKWRCEKTRHDKGNLLLIKEERNGIVIIKISQDSLVRQLTTLSESLNVTADDKVISVECKSSSFIIYGIILPLYLGCNFFLLPLHISIQSPEVWSRIVERHKISCFISQVFVFSWATQIQKVGISLKSLENVILLDGREVTCLRHAQLALPVLAEKCEFNSRCVKSLVTTELGSAIGFVALDPDKNLIVSRDSLQNSLCQFHEEPSYESIEIPAAVTLLSEVEIIIVKESVDENEATCYAPVTKHNLGHVFVKSDFFQNDVVGLEKVSKFIFNQEIEGIRGTWANTGLTGTITESEDGDKLMVFGLTDEKFPVVSLANSSTLSIYSWDLHSTILAFDKSAVIFQKLHVFSVSVANQFHLVMVAELKKMYTENEINALIDNFVDGIIKIHQIGPFVVSLHAPNQLPSYNDGRLHLWEIEEKFVSGDLDSTYCTTLPWKTLEASLPMAIAPGCVVGAAGMVCGSVISGTELSYMTGNTMRQVSNQTLAQRLISLASGGLKEVEPIVCIETMKDSKVYRNSKINIPDAHKNASRISLLLEKNQVSHGDLVLINYDCPIKIFSAIYGCWYRGAVPIPIKASPDNALLECVAQSIKIQFVVSSNKKSIQNIFPKSIPIIEIENPQKMETASFNSLTRDHYVPPTLELRCLVDCYISPAGGLIARQYSWKNVLAIAQSLKDQMEVYRGREIDIALDYTYGTGLFLLCVVSIYTGCRIIAHSVTDIEMKTPEFLNVSLPNLRDIFVSASIARNISQLKVGQVNNMKFKNTRSFNVVYQNVSPDSVVISRLSTLLESCGLQTRSISICCSFQSVPLLTLRSGIAKTIKSTFIDLTALKSGRVKFSKKGSKYAVLVHEAGSLMPGAEVVIADVSNGGQCGMGRFGEVWLRCDWSCSNYLCSYGGKPQITLEELQKTTITKLMAGNDKGIWCRSGMLGFLKKENNETSLYVIGNMIEHISHRGFQFHPDLIEQTMNKSHSSISNSCCVSVQDDIICLIETTLSPSRCFNLSSKITSCLADIHHMIVSIIIMVAPRSIPMSTQGNPQRQRAAEMLIQEKFNPILIAYNS